MKIYDFPFTASCFLPRAMHIRSMKMLLMVVSIQIQMCCNKDGSRDMEDVVSRFCNEIEGAFSSPSLHVMGHWYTASGA